MIENNTIDSYKNRVEEYNQELNNLNHHLEELEKEKNFPKLQYEQEKRKINEYIQKVLAQKIKTELILNSYESIKSNQTRLTLLHQIVPRDNQEEKELLEEIASIEKEIDKNLLILPVDLRQQLTEKSPQISGEEDLENNSNHKTLEDYRKNLEDNKNEVQHLLTEIENLKMMENTLPHQEFIKELNTLKRYLNRERGKLLRNRQIITAYEIVENNQDRIAYLNTIIARDDQDRRQINEEVNALTHEINQNKRFIPKSLQKALEEKPAIDSNSTYQTISSGNTTQLNAESVVEELIPEQTEELRRNTQEYPIENSNSEYYDEEVTPEQFEEYEKKLRDRIEKEKGQTISKSNVIPLPDNSKNEHQISSAKFDKIIQKINTLTGSKNLSNISPDEPKNSPENNQNAPSSKFSNIINSLNNGKYSSSNPTHQENTSFFPSAVFNEKNLEQDKKTDSSNQDIENVDERISSEDNRKEQTELPRIDGEVVGVRKPKKNYRKKLIYTITGVAVSLVLIASGASYVKNKISQKQNNQTTFVGDVNSADNINIISNSNQPVETLENNYETIATENYTTSASDIVNNNEIENIETNMETENVTSFIPDIEIIDFTENNQNVSSNLENKGDNSSTPDIEIIDETSYNKEIPSGLESETLIDINPVSNQQVVQGVEVNTTIPDQSPTTGNESMMDIGGTEVFQNYIWEDQNTIDLLEEKTSITLPEEKTVENNNIKIGAEVNINGKIHNDEYDAYYQNNSQNPYYGTEPRRVVIGVGIVNDNGMNTIYAYDPNANQKIDQLINEGGELVSILTANKDRYLTDYDGSETLIPDEIRAYAEGWYNINDVTMPNRKGVSR